MKLVVPSKGHIRMDKAFVEMEGKANSFRKYPSLVKRLERLSVIWKLK